MVKAYGEILNRIAEERGYPEPEVGMKATEMLPNDRAPYEIVRVEKKEGKVVRFWMKECVLINRKPIGPGYEAEGGEIREGTPEIEVGKNKLGQWREITERIRDNGKVSRRMDGWIVAPGVNEAYRCPEI